MIRLPWVSRLAFDLVCQERNRIAEQNEKLVSHFARLERVDHGLAELPREQRPPIEAMPEDLENYIKGFAFPAYRREMRNTVYRRHLRGESWGSIMETLKEGEPERKEEEDRDS